MPHVFVMAPNTILNLRSPGLVGAPARGETTSPTASIVGKPSHGRAVLNTDGALTYAPARGFTGHDSFTYRIARDTTTSADATVTVIVGSTAGPARRPTAKH
jgi:hypothetical protein